MALHGKLLQRVSNTKSADVMHTSGYASVQNGQSFGATSSTSFSERQSIDDNRKLVQAYRNAKIAQGVNHMPKAKTFENEIKDSWAERMQKATAKSQQDAKRTADSSMSRCETAVLRREELNARFSTSTPSRDNASQKANRTLGFRQKQQNASAQRQATSNRFSASARPVPKTGFGFGR